MTPDEDFKDFLDGLRTFSNTRSSLHNPISFTAGDESSGLISSGDARCTYSRESNLLKIWFLKPHENPNLDQPNMNLTWTDQGWECETFLGTGLWESEDLAQECVSRLLDLVTSEDFKL